MGVSHDLLSLMQKRIPGQLVIQFTDHCNARCPQCGMRVTEAFPRTKLSVDRIKRILDRASETGIKIVSFTGGEPLLFLDELVVLIKYAGSAGIEYIRTGTNGFLFTQPERPGFRSRVNRIAEMLADTPLRNLWISIDSAIPSVHEKMRGFPGVIAGIEEAVPIFHGHGIYPSANLGINRNIGGAGSVSDGCRPADEDYLPLFMKDMKAAFRSFYRFAINMGFTIINTCYPMSIHGLNGNASLKPIYAANSTDYIVHYSSGEKAMLFRALMETVPEFRSKSRIFSPRCSLDSLYRQYAQGTMSDYPCRGGIDCFFIDSKDGNAYPCGFRGKENLGDFCELDREKLNREPFCHHCDWECFRDPSEMFGPILHARRNPFGLLKNIANRGSYFKIWMEDLRYYLACDFFDGRKPPAYDRLSAWQGS
ncbi:radical SAM protein [Desulforhabdus amnigena]|uniref:Radical SAM core domain-containing protein n=1 Tax=Desulforhabdus amnigena TaxID=40218 RepID=A0A9W6FT08_9BACT|nr:radical SAM protein [Desulforhabdus amnigena]GLI34683.1 hypothetical protein DAMNIGENAA_21160 [Desulforhabdus amnigena]